MCAKTSYQKGIDAEEQAALFLQAKGFEILQKRYKTPYGEIDLIAQKEGLLSFVEVKTRPSTAQALQSITPKAKFRISQTAEIFLSEWEQPYDVARFDVIALTSNGAEYIENAWRIDELY